MRADTLVSLRIKHINREQKLILQDAGVVRAKAGKNINIYWFQIPAAFEKVVLDWIDTLLQLDFSGEDAPFPNGKHLKHHLTLGGRKVPKIPVMSTTHAVTDAFTIACRNIDIKYTPHSAKHTIGAERDIRSLTHEQRKAWSLNMGHESELTTERHYGTMSDDRRLEVLESLGNVKKGIGLMLTDKEKVALVDELLMRISVE